MKKIILASTVVLSILGSAQLSRLLKKIKQSQYEKM